MKEYGTFDDNGNEVYAIPYLPIGTIWMMATSTSPANYFGGTWTQIAQGRTIIGVDTSDSDFNTVLKTGGSKTHTHSNPSTGATSITAKQLPVSAIVREYRSTGAGNTNLASGVTGWGNYENGYGQSDRGQGHNHSMGNTGSSSNVQPYITCYIWKKTAM